MSEKHCAIIVAIALALAIAIAGMAVVSGLAKANEIPAYLQGTAEGPDNDYTPRWYALHVLDAFDSAIEAFCNVIGRDDWFLMWRTWLKETRHITIY